MDREEYLAVDNPEGFEQPDTLIETDHFGNPRASDINWYSPAAVARAAAEIGRRMK